MSKLIHDFFRLKWNRNNPESSTEETIMERAEDEEMKMPSFKEAEMLRWEDLRAYMLASIHRAIVRARYMEIITGYSDNIKATISDSYDDVIQAILAKPEQELEIDKIAVRILQDPLAPVRTEDAVIKSAKERDELRCDDVIARTWIGIDGDIAMLLPKDRRIDPELLALHRANVDVSVQNWSNILDTVVKVIGLLSRFIPGYQQSSPPKT
jgi:hypothetical protein